MVEVGIFARVDRNVADAFKNHVLRVHGKLHGAMSLELEKAMRDYIDTHSNIHTHTASGRRKEKAEDIKKEILKTHDNEITKREVEHYIARIAGADPRTINAYFQILTTNTFLEHEKFGIYKIKHE